MSIVTRLPVKSLNPLLPVVSDAELSPFGGYVSPIPPMFDRLHDYWLLGGSADSLVGLKSETNLVPQAATPVYAGGYLTMSSGVGNALLSDKVDSASQTVCVIYQIDSDSTAGVRVIAGTQQTSSVSPQNGSAMFTELGDSKSVSGATRGTSSAIKLSQGASTAGNWLFAAYSESGAGPSVRTLFIGGATPVSSTVNDAGAKSVSSRKIALGNGYYTGAPVVNRNFASFLLYDYALSTDELAAVYEWAKKDMSDRGLTLF